MNRKRGRPDPDEWPESDENEGAKLDAEGNPITNRPWLHSDIREKAFSHNWKAYKEFVEIGNLNEQHEN